MIRVAIDERTHTTLGGSLQGAFLSGIREADPILAA